VDVGLRDTALIHSAADVLESRLAELDRLYSA
jgi:hypothetical protein